LGGAKVNDKIKLIDNLLEKVDEMIIGGGMAFTFLKVLYDIDIGNSLFDKEGAKQVPEIMRRAEECGVKIHLPEDFLMGDFNDPDTHVLIGDLESGVAEGLWGLDIGPKTAANNAEVIARCNTIVWNGPQGFFEN
jgi:phosphoglycerate kinase